MDGFRYRTARPRPREGELARRKGERTTVGRTDGGRRAHQDASGRARGLPRGGRRARASIAMSPRRSAARSVRDAAEPPGGRHCMNDKPAPPPKAVALRYDGKGAPRVVAKGSGEVARQILVLAVVFVFLLFVFWVL